METEQLNSIKDKFEQLHSNDAEHLEAIFSDKQRLIVEAPAGSGKTKILISKIAYNIATNNIPSNKKILALTFSVNAAYKIKKDVVKNIPELTKHYNSNPSLINNIITVTNFHGFARRVLKKYGRLLNGALANIDMLEGISDSTEHEIQSLNLGLNNSEIQWIISFNNLIVSNEVNYTDNREYFLKYLEFVDKFFLVKGKIPFNGYLIYLLRLFEKYPQIKYFYSILYPIIIIDEFQDTNSLAWQIIENLVSENSRLWFLGDSLQRIYGFIGAIESLIPIAQKEFSMYEIELHTNYRFKDNAALLQLDKNIRECARLIANAKPVENAYVPIYTFASLAEENKWCINHIKNFLDTHQTGSLAILIKQRSQDIDELIRLLNEEGIEFFYALFNDDDTEYINFHTTALEIFKQQLQEKGPRTISKQFLGQYLNWMQKKYNDGSVIQRSLLVLLEAFINNLQKEYMFLERDEKISYITDMLVNRSLKQCMEYIDSRVILSTVHGAKGLEWDHVMVRGMKNYSFPSFSLCNTCNRCGYNDSKCILNLESIAQDKVALKCYLEELSVFYVAVTRAKKDLCLTTNEERVNSQGRRFPAQLSCFLNLPGIVPDFKQI